MFTILEYTLKEKLNVAQSGCRIHQLHQFWGVRLPSECTEYDTKQSDAEVPGTLELWGNTDHPFVAIAPAPYL